VRALRRAGTYLLIFFAVSFVAAPFSRAGVDPDQGRAEVIADEAAVYSRADPKSTVVGRLTKGERVTIEFEMEGSGRAWCAVEVEGGTGQAGYVPCDALERRKKKLWGRVGESGVAYQGRTTPVTIVGNTVLVPVSIGYGHNSAKVSLVFDTGASGTVINRSVAKRLNIDLERAVVVPVRVVGGGVLGARLAKLDYLSVGPKRKQDMTVGVIDDKGQMVGRGGGVEVDGLLGMDFLRGLNYEVDFDEEVIRWE
jgi:hypothetical protein